MVRRTALEMFFFNLPHAPVLKASEDGSGHGALSRDGRHVAVSDVTWLRIFDAATGQPERTIELPGSGNGGFPAFSPDGTLVATPNEIAIELFEVSTGRRVLDDPSTQARYVAHTT